MCECRNSIGSSIVMMCSSRVRLISSIIAASVVDLPEPVGPVTSTKPRGLRANSCTIGGRPRSSIEVSPNGIRRNAAPIAPRWKYALTRKRAWPGNRIGEVDLPVGLKPLALVVVEDRVDDLPRVSRRELRVGLKRGELAAHADRRMGARAEVKIRGLAATTSMSMSAKSMSIARPSVPRGGDSHALSRLDEYTSAGPALRRRRPYAPRRRHARPGA